MTPEQKAFIKKVAPAAQIAAKTFGIPASVTIAQAILESGWGQHAPGNNFFGIKKGAANVPYMAFETAEIVNGKSQKQTANFRSYATPTMCFGDHAKILSTEPRYAKAMAKTGDPLQFALMLRDCGYSTDPQYGKKLGGIISDYGLEKFDGRAG